MKERGGNFVLVPWYWGNHAIMGLVSREVTRDRGITRLGRGPNPKLFLVTKLRNVPERMEVGQSLG
jgi:hypothetical protein